MNNIRAYRIKKGLTQTELALKTDLSVGYVCHLEKGTRSNPSFAVMKKIATILEQSISDIFTL